VRVIESKPPETFAAGELATRAGVSTDTLRHYERKGIIDRPQRQPNGYRRYPACTVERVLLVRRALTIGFTLDELVQVLKVRDRGGVPCRTVRNLAGQKLTAIEQRLRELAALRDELRATLQDWDARIVKAGPNKCSRLLENLQVNNGSQRPGAPTFSSNRQPINKRKTK
jgi:DNA-binding transcriptional MerR regulator